ncbi:hypothetical protein N665_2708s0003 [Sinapis alba]|nr:hypothetical protein N665_2708s0003 [Sinapis alba]
MHGSCLSWNTYAMKENNITVSCEDLFQGGTPSLVAVKRSPPLFPSAFCPLGLASSNCKKKYVLRGSGFAVVSNSLMLPPSP